MAQLMETVNDYLVVYANDPIELQDKCRIWLIEGWYPLGAPFVWTEFDMKPVLLQALVK